MDKPIQGGQIDDVSPSSSHLFYEKEAAVETQTQIGDKFYGTFLQHFRNLGRDCKSFQRPLVARLKFHQNVSERRRGVCERDVETLLQKGHHLRLSSYCLPVKPVSRQVTPTLRKA